MKKIIVLSFAAMLVLNACSWGTKPLAPGSTSETTDSDEPTTSNETYPLYLTTMTHMEGDFKDDTDEDLFNIHVEELRFAMDLAEEYDAILTIESEKPFAKANTVWDLNIMQEIVDRGFGVGTHCDVGGPKGEKESPEDFAKELQENKELVDGLVGAENNHGCSGAGGLSDWAQSLTLAGFDYVNGIVGMHLLAVPEDERPMAWDDKYILRGAYHYSFPEDYLERIYLYQLSDTKDWIPDTEGIVISSGEFGRFDALAEGGYQNIDAGCPKGVCPMTMDDVDAFVSLVEEINANRDASKVAKMDLYFPVNNFEPENEEVLRAFFEAAQKLQKEGQLQWSTQWDVVQSYLASLQS